MPKTVLSESPYHRTEYARDEHDESGIVHSKKTFYDDEIAERNAANRTKGTVKTGDDSPIHRGSKVVYFFKVNPMQWADFKRRHPDVAEGLHSKDRFVREKACADIKDMHPEWVIAAPRAAS